MVSFTKFVYVKKISCVILTIFYLSYVTGATVYQHYCMGEWVSSTLYHVSDQECSKCGMKKHTEESKNCCKDISVVVKTDNAHLYSQFIYNYDCQVLTLCALTSPVIAVRLSYQATSEMYKGNSPPLLQNPLFIQFRNFRI